MHTRQTVDFVREKVPPAPGRSSEGAERGRLGRPPVAVLTCPFLAQHAQFGSFSYKRMTVMEAVDMLDGLVDESDPDVDFPNSFHAFQTAEGIRKAHPDKGAPPPRAAAVGGPRLPSRPRPQPASPLPPRLVPPRRAPARPGEGPGSGGGAAGEGRDAEGPAGLGAQPRPRARPPLSSRASHAPRRRLVCPQWAVVGDTFPVGCRPQASVVFRDTTFQDNPDLQDPRYRCCSTTAAPPPHAPEPLTPPLSPQHGARHVPAPLRP